MRPKDDLIYIQRVLDGDNQAFAEIVKRYHSIVFTLAFRILKNREEAEDLAQDVFIKVFKSLGMFNRKAKLSTWIYRITYNTSINSLNSRTRIQTIEIEDDHRRELKNLSIANPHDDLRKKEEKQIINNAILKLPEKDKVIITLYYYEELSVKEIAEIIGISVQNVKVKLYRSRQKLYTELKDKIGQEKILTNGFQK
ncbi:RNA polymerase sigma factor [Xanthovirga aplysinae]|uniref:RNA polymerase sigma factor n=1 Tax=Xanthovirga aplysinae TaxID=2529853 RepID=UPI0012BC635A|nr:sigma-70 family RNA polymerase sigma factor [Xanthovirga aplysinae]MTI32147.1 sigma-70 family RNA polymerase sigma factor [Xanthovirga aplysinae]